MHEFRRPGTSTYGKWLKALALMMLVVSANTLSGCSLFKKQKLPFPEQPYTLNLTLLASSDLNPNAQSRPSPVQVRVFVMKPQTDITTIAFEKLFEYGDVIMDPPPASIMTMLPGQATTITVPAKKAQSMIIVAAAYREPYTSVWKAIVDIKPTDEVNASATIGANTVTLHPSL